MFKVEALTLKEYMERKKTLVYNRTQKDKL